MKRIITFITGLMLSAIALAQPGFYIERQSETEYVKVNDGRATTAETYIRDFISKYGIEKYHNVIKVIENGTIDKEIQILKDKGIDADFILGVQTLKYIDEAKTSFIANGKFYILTYQPVKINNLGSLSEKKVFLYRRDDDSMRIASGLIRKDVYAKDKFVEQFMINTNDEESIYHIADSIVVLVTKTNVWNFNYSKNGYDIVTFNTLIVLIPDGNYGYNMAYFEPKIKTKFAVNKISSTSTDSGLTLKYESGTIIFKIVGNNVVLSDSSTIKLSREK